MTSNNFKQRYRNYQKSFNNEEYKNETELSKFIWGLKLKKGRFTVNWLILSRATAYQSGASKCKAFLRGEITIDKSRLKDFAKQKRRNYINVPTQDQIQNQKL